MSKLRQLIRESITEYIREIDAAGTKAGLGAKIEATESAINKREKMAAMEGIDEAYHEMLDKGKMKEISGEVKALKKSLEKLKKQLDKLNSKGNKSEESEEVEEKEIVDEITIDENAEDSPYKVNSKDKKYLSMPGMENFDEDLRYDEEGNEDINGMYDAGGNFVGDQGQSMDKAEYDNDPMNESFLHMQKLAGVITEAQYKAKLKK